MIILLYLILYNFIEYNNLSDEEQEKIKIHIRFHPAYEEDIPQDLLRLENISLFSAKKYTEIMDYLNLFDVLITDYSSIYFDYMLLNGCAYYFNDLPLEAIGL